MSTQSGITASPELLKAFQDSQSDVLVVTVSDDSTQLVPDDKCPRIKGDLQDNFRQLQLYLSDIHPQPVYIIIAVGEGEHAFISFIPDVAHIRDKMLYASTKNTLLQQLGSTTIKKDYLFNWSEVEEISYEHFNDSKPDKIHDQSEGPLTEEEKYMKQMNSLQDYSAAGNSSYSQKLASMDNSSTQLLFKIDDALESEFEALNDNNRLILFNIDLGKETFQLMKSVANIQVDALISTLESLQTDQPTPKFAIYNYLPSKYALIYTCPSGSRVKDRMIYASNKQGLINHLKTLFKSKNLQLDKVLDIGDTDELEISELKQADEPSSSSSSSSTPAAKTGLRFNKPKGPRRK